MIYFRLEAQLRYLVNGSFDTLQDCSIIHYQSIDPNEYYKEFKSETKDEIKIQVESFGLDSDGKQNDVSYFTSVFNLQRVIM